MDEKDFQVTQDLLKAVGLEVQESLYSDESFGSWNITVLSAPSLRIVWDGKDSWLCVQQATDEIFAGSTVWRDLWIAKERIDQNPQRAISELLRATNT